MSRVETDCNSSKGKGGICPNNHLGWPPKFAKEELGRCFRPIPEFPKNFRSHKFRFGPSRLQILYPFTLYTPPGAMNKTSTSRRFGESLWLSRRPMLIPKGLKLFLVSSPDSCESRDSQVPCQTIAFSVTQKKWYAEGSPFLWMLPTS